MYSGPAKSHAGPGRHPRDDLWVRTPHIGGDHATTPESGTPYIRHPNDVYTSAIYSQQYIFSLSAEYFLLKHLSIPSTPITTYHFIYKLICFKAEIAEILKLLCRMLLLLKIFITLIFDFLTMANILKVS